MPKEKVLLFFANTKYSVHYHGYITKEGFIHVRKRDTSMPDNYDHVDVLKAKSVRMYEEEELKSDKHGVLVKDDDGKYIVEKEERSWMGVKFYTDGRPHASEKVRARVVNALNDLLDKARLPYVYTQDNLKKLYALGVR